MSVYEDREKECVYQTCEAEVSCVSMKSDSSMIILNTFSDGAVTSDPVWVLFLCLID